VEEKLEGERGARPGKMMRLTPLRLVYWHQFGSLPETAGREAEEREPPLYRRGAWGHRQLPGEKEGGALD